MTERIVDELLEDLRERYGSVEWRIQLAEDRLVSPPATLSEIFESARARLLAEDWDIAVAITDLPLRRNRRPAARQVSRTYGIGLVSLPALGALNLQPRLRRALLELVGELAGDTGGEPRSAVLRELAGDTDARPGVLGLLFVPAVFAGNLRLLVGMLRANRPWRFAARLSRALAAAVAAAAYGVVATDVWRLSDAMHWWRLAGATMIAILVTTVFIIAAHDLWERAPDPRVREQVVLFNIATTATVAIGILTLSATLFGLVLAGAGLAIAPDFLGQELGHSADVGDYATLAWFVTSLATVGGALGAVLESDEAVREAAYSSASKAEQ